MNAPVRPPKRMIAGECEGRKNATKYRYDDVSKKIFKWRHRAQRRPVVGAVCSADFPPVLSSFRPRDATHGPDGKSRQTGIVYWKSKTFPKLPQDLYKPH